MCCNGLQCVTKNKSSNSRHMHTQGLKRFYIGFLPMNMHAAVCCNVLQYAAFCCSVLQRMNIQNHVTVPMKMHAAVCCSALQRKKIQGHVTYKWQGLRGFYTGFLPTVARNTPTVCQSLLPVFLFANPIMIFFYTILYLYCAVPKKKSFKCFQMLYSEKTRDYFLQMKQGAVERVCVCVCERKGCASVLMRGKGDVTACVCVSVKYMWSVDPPPPPPSPPPSDLLQAQGGPH